LRIFISSAMGKVNHIVNGLIKTVMVCMVIMVGFVSCSEIESPPLSDHIVPDYVDEVSPIANWTIEDGGIGPFRIDEGFYELKHGLSDEFEVNYDNLHPLTGFGFNDFATVSFRGEKLFTLHPNAKGKIGAIRILKDEMATSKGIGSLSTIDELTKGYPDCKVYVGKGIHPYNVCSESLKGIAFQISENAFKQRSPEADLYEYSVHDKTIFEIDEVKPEAYVRSITIGLFVKQSPQNKIYNLRERADFFIREGNYLYSESNFSRGKHLLTESLPMYEADLARHYYRVNTKDLKPSDQALLKKNIFIETSDSVYSGKTASFRIVNEELLEHREDLLAEYDQYEENYGWVGNEDGFTNDHSMIYCDFGAELDGEVGDWGLISNVTPNVFVEKDLSIFGEKAKFFNEELEKHETHAIVFSSDTLDLVVTYHEEEECGERYNTGVRLWKATKDGFELVQELHDVPLVIMDADLDNDLDILYEEGVNDRFYYSVEISYPSYELIDGEEVFLGCGC